MRAYKDIILQALPYLGNGFIRELLKGRDLVSMGIGVARWKKTCEKCIGAFLPGFHYLLVGKDTRAHRSPRLLSELE
jgi:hypothetical protein